MNYDGKILSAARDVLDERRRANQEEQNRRARLIQDRIPEIPVLEARMRAQMPQLLHLAASREPDAKDRLAALRRQNLELQMRRSELLVEHGYDAEYLNEILSCPRCGDSGFTRQGMCSCLMEEYNRLLSRELSSLLQTGEEDFSHFDETLYSDLPDSPGSLSPRQQMCAVRDICRRYADNFPNVSSNLLLSGGPGLGKTFLSACIARCVAEKGCSVCYVTASEAFDAFEAVKFDRDSAGEASAQRLTDRILDCELLILDDLGTEFISQMSCSSLYTILNTRLTRHLPMILSTNLDEREIEKRYTRPIVSRILGEFLLLPFAGTDIRRGKK